MVSSDSRASADGVPCNLIPFKKSIHAKMSLSKNHQASDSVQIHAATGRQRLLRPLAKDFP